MSQNPRPPSEEASDSTINLLRRAKGGDEAALGLVMQRYAPRLKRWATGRLPVYARDALDTDDLVQDALMATTKRIESFEPRHPGALMGYLCQILRNRIRREIDRARRRPRKAALDPDQIDRTPSPVEALVGREAVERYESALARLKDDDRALIMLRCEWGLGYDELAAEMEKPSVDAARMAVRRALLRLAKEMGDGQ